MFEHVKGVTSATAGYAGGSVRNPSYERVSSGTTGHAESVLVVYDPSQVSYAQLLQVFFTVALDPTELNRQGPDVGTQYRSIVFYREATQHRAATAFIADLTSRKVYAAPIVTEVDSLGAFYPAEGLSPALHAAAPERALYRLQRRAEGEESAARLPSALLGRLAPRLTWATRGWPALRAG